MPRLIDADKLKDIISDTWILDRIDEQPTVDAVEVVRCKDCKYWECDVIFSDGWCRGKHQGNPSWFCADGERREDAETD